jgi:glyoxylase-like metal-dependent hydrolase (beta-lactamase superfamily II)
MKITSIRTSGLGDATYLVAHQGIGVVVDPQRDIARFESAATDGGVEVRFVLETHLHNDYVSGGRDLAKRTGAELVIPAAGAVAYDHRPAFHLEDLDGGPLTVRPIHTPGHTPEHMSYLILIDGEPIAVFSGGSLLVGSAGRPDLLGFERAEQLARLQYISVNRLAELPDDVGLYPTHGEGSFCTATGAGKSTSTIGAEKLDNPVLHYPDADAFVKGQLGGLQPYPDYYAYMGPINLMGPTPLPHTTVPELGAGEVPPDAAIVDMRPRAAFAAGHIPGSLGIEFDDQVGVWAGWLLPFDQPVVLVADRGQDVVEAVAQFGRIGFDHVAGVLYDVAGWSESNGPLDSYRQETAQELSARIAAGETPQIVDVRAPNEWEASRIEGSQWRYVPDIREGMPAGLDPEQEVHLICRTGNRATIAASLVIEAGFTPIVVAKGGVEDVLQELNTG